MLNFDFQNPTRVIFGKGAVEKLGPVMKESGGTKVLLHYGGGSIKASGLYDTVKKSLAASGVEVEELGGVVPNPRLSLVQEGIKICRQKGLNFILAVGGGSVIDSAKAIGIGVPYDGDVWDFFTDKATPLKALPVATILTIPAAGSETSPGSVITNEDGAFKRAVNSVHMFPVFSILDPELTYTLPPYQTACGIADMLVHVVERYLTQERNVELTDRLCEATMKTIINNAPIVMANPNDYAARAELMWAGSIAHNNLLDTGRLGDWACHMIEHELSAINDVAHGAGLAVILPSLMMHIYKQDPQRFVQFAVRVFGVEENFHDPKQTILRGIEALRSFFTSIGLPSTLKGIGIGEDQFQKIGEKTKKFDTGKGTVGNSFPLTSKDIVEILQMAK